jgi:hypothetical protein
MIPEKKCLLTAREQSGEEVRNCSLAHAGTESFTGCWQRNAGIMRRSPRRGTPAAAMWNTVPGLVHRTYDDEFLSEINKYHTISTTQTENPEPERLCLPHPHSPG